MSTFDKFEQMVIAVVAFAVVFAVIMLLADRIRGRSADRSVAMVFLVPTVVLLAVGLVYPAIRTLLDSFRNAEGTKFIGIDNYQTVFSDHDLLIVLLNTVLWVVFVPFFATAIGLLYALVIDKSRVEAIAKALVFLPMAISFVGASIIWKFVYTYKGAGSQIGLLNEILVKLGLPAQQFLLNWPSNTFWLIVVMIWIQAGFAMTVLSAAIKAIPQDIIEAARLDGVNAVGMFRFVTLPSIRPAVIVVLTTIAIGTLKVFDIVRTMTGGQFDTSVIANEFYNQSFNIGDEGLGATLAVILFVLVIPVVIYNVRQLRKADAR
ncbi:carbohydrate ABC transporter membrane protein 1 (CUT1 family) [Motilibacter rhizosphaerae]|uniref:Carbohydrate ABC transporter membrane protein 1 (CUT1 family) n=1 Tax=Motilibacter rhizosphaerae TaxID=598652 RepID=A0A4V2F493_9ACTN|nr:sugar ABC transporter permease [Motilibacter rhizosphaerae]RZS86807.1 carbohydrate ABC transporter membrane protein 1 (CUT1 family) [Motilibacter rhizosphaerae]